MCFDSPTSIYHLNNFTRVIPWIPVNKRKEKREKVEEEKEGGSGGEWRGKEKEGKSGPPLRVDLP
jgi:hypothetical protein